MLGQSETKIVLVLKRQTKRKQEPPGRRRMICSCIQDCTYISVVLLIKTSKYQSFKFLISLLGQILNINCTIRSSLLFGGLWMQKFRASPMTILKIVQSWLGLEQESSPLCQKMAFASKLVETTLKSMPIFWLFLAWPSGDSHWWSLSWKRTILWSRCRSLAPWSTSNQW